MNRRPCTSKYITFKRNLAMWLISRIPSWWCSRLEIHAVQRLLYGGLKITACLLVNMSLPECSTTQKNHLKRNIVPHWHRCQVLVQDQVLFLRNEAQVIANFIYVCTSNILIYNCWERCRCSWRPQNYWLVHIHRSYELHRTLQFLCHTPMGIQFLIFKEQNQTLSEQPTKNTNLLNSSSWAKNSPYL